MLKELHIKNFALIDELFLGLDKGLNVLTGETGAGKTLVLEGMNLLIGKRADTLLIGKGNTEALVEASIELPEGEHVIGRTVSADGKNKCHIDGKLATVAMIAGLMDSIVDFHGQHEHQALLKQSHHIDYLDEFAGSGLAEVKKEYKEIHLRLNTLKKTLEDLKMSEEEMAAKMDLLHFQIDEIEKADLKEGEDLDLEKDRLKVQNAERLKQAMIDARNALSGGDQGEPASLDGLRVAAESMKGLEGIDDELAKSGERLQEILMETEEINRDIGGYLQENEYETERLNEIEDRLHEIKDIMKKYGGSIAAAIEHKDIAKVELELLTKRDAKIDGIEGEIEESEKELRKIAKRLSDIRRCLSGDLKAAVEKELKEIGLKDCVFEVVCEEADDYKVDGMDRVEFLIGPNAGESPKPLVRIASGGEVSRIMLALKIALTKADPVPILIFDEIDAGVGGKTAAKVGAKLAYLSQGHQVIAITHLPQIAAFADSHYHVSKNKKADRTITTVKGLDKAGRLNELARMLSGIGISDITRSHANELLEDAYNLKLEKSKR